mmetsp:Transcript_76918/g.222334  ORF Transcript_76918/g.222334 Transcript_76918/m.222334 type:complete len:216 (+) Transcript_76918:1853-2500(+)
MDRDRAAPVRVEEGEHLGVLVLGHCLEVLAQKAREVLPRQAATCGGAHLRREEFEGPAHRREAVEELLPELPHRPLRDEAALGGRRGGQRTSGLRLPPQLHRARLLPPLHLVLLAHGEDLLEHSGGGSLLLLQGVFLDELAGLASVHVGRRRVGHVELVPAKPVELPLHVGQGVPAPRGHLALGGQGGADVDLLLLAVGLRLQRQPLEAHGLVWP